MKQRFTFNVGRLHAKIYPLAGRNLGIAEVAHALGYDERVVDACGRGWEGLRDILGPGFRHVKNEVALVMAINCAIMHVGNQGFQYWYPLAQALLAQHTLKGGS